MSYLKLDRRTFLGASASALLVAPFPQNALATTTYVRLEWEQFKLTPQYGSFINALQTMMANKTASSPNSWLYWANVHANYCPHKMPYFLAWHRGYLYYLEKQLRIVSGDNALTLPYWDWFHTPSIPPEFTDSASGNPLFCPRLNNNVYSSLDLSPFAATTVNFQRGTANSFEEKFETAPHNPVHNLIGNVMATMQSPRDPIFYLHHANVDRLWHAWALPDGRTMPVPTAAYWAGTFTYATGLTIKKSDCYSNRRTLGYDYANTNRPTALPPQANAAHIIRVQAQITPLRSRPALVSLAATPARTLATGRRAIGGVKGLALREASVSVRVTTEASSTQDLQDLLSATSIASSTDAKSSSATQALAVPASRYRSVKIVFDGLALTRAGAAGGYFYNVYLNLPDKVDAETAKSTYFIGTLGPFEIAGAAHHGDVELEFPATEALAKMGAGATREYVVSLVRVNGSETAKGEVMTVGEVRVELTNDAPFIVQPAVSRKPGDAY
ncbi:tyrosinase family protein [Caballeronia sp. LP006]|jgi:tyrosinase|uniref:tyrosinase family protein n=1 Tax=unclassified Caballeronia TaxID=2646786 RepID=UPI001FD38BE0|nr:MULTISPECIES: tyrosinase family protein [unclassified Caballeronia]MDR5805982.1 tyrosinase family protein [Caballeronia sp. LZ001]MDR5826435.1 tyrosinase family protein [Caballeronia sp. LP006]